MPASFVNGVRIDAGASGSVSFAPGVANVVVVLSRTQQAANTLAFTLNGAAADITTRLGISERYVRQLFYTPPSGSVTLAWSGAASYAEASVFSLAGVDLTGVAAFNDIFSAAPVDLFAQTTSTTITDDITSVADQLVIDAIHLAAGSIATAGAGQTRLAATTGFVNGSYEVATGVTTTMSWSLGTTSTFDHFVGAVKGSASGPTPPYMSVSIRI